MKIKIKSSDLHGQNYEQNFEVKSFLNFENKKEIHYEDEYGKCKILKFGDFVEIYRYGQINSKQVFKQDKKTSFTYFTKEFKGKYEIFTKIIIIENEKIYLEYDIINNNEIFNSIKLEITELN